jgi:hypothetical protein
MSVLSRHQSQTRPDSYALANELIAASYAHPSDKIIIAGASRLELLIALLRRGFVDAACMSTARELHSTGDAGDILIAPALESEADLPEILQCVGGALRPGGLLVIRADASLAPCDEAQLRATFMQFGFAAVERFASGNRGDEIWLAHRQNKSLAQAA